MTTTVYLVIAGNIIDDYNKTNENTDNMVEVFDNLEAAELFGSLFDYHSVTPKELRSVWLSPGLSVGGSSL
jgi:hypothetical protein